MAYQALYRKYRPSNFDEVVGQQHIIQTLKNAVYQNRIGHAYLFCGPRGTGKTSIAKIFAKMLNCTNERNKPCGNCLNCQMVANGNHPDIIEIDAASNNGVDEVRNLIDKVKYAPLNGKYKVYIIDEVHMMTPGAFNALLKTVEEPPEHVIFIFATTEPNKVLPTIISRCQRFDFSKVSQQDIERRLGVVCKSENIEIEPEAISLIAKLADGGMRDSLSILDQCVAYCVSNITVEDVRNIYGVLNTQDIANLFYSLYKNNVDGLMNDLQRYSNMGIDLQRMFSDMIHLIKESIILDYSPRSTLISESNKIIIEDKMLASKVSYRLSVLDTMMDTYSKFSYSSNLLDYIQTCFLSIISNSYDLDKDRKIDTSNKCEKEEIKENPSKLYEETSEKSDIKEEIQNSPIQDNVKQENMSYDVSRETLKEEKEEEKKVSLNNEYVLQLLVGAKKSERQSDSENMKNIDMYLVDLNYAKYAASLRNISIVASGDTYIVISVKSEIEARGINEIQLHEGYEDFFAELLGKPKKVFAIDQNQQSKIISEFKERMINGTLPEPCEVKLKSKNTTTQNNSVESQIKEVFPTLLVDED